MGNTDLRKKKRKQKERKKDKNVMLPYLEDIMSTSKLNLLFRGRQPTLTEGHLAIVHLKPENMDFVVLNMDKLK